MRRVYSEPSRLFFSAHDSAIAALRARRVAVNADAIASTWAHPDALSRAPL